MTVPAWKDTPFAPTASEAEAVLTARTGAAVHLGSVERISEEGRRNLLLRVTVADGPSTLPASLIIKQASPDDFNADDPAAWSTRGLFADWAGLEFLNRSGADVTGCPRFYGGCRDRGFVLMEDLGNGESPARLLMTGSAPEAEQALLQLVETLGRMHAATAGRAEEYRAIRLALGPSGPDQARGDGGQLRKHLPALLAIAHRVGVVPPPGFDEDVDQILAALDDPGPFLTYTHGDPCPDNAMFEKGRLRLFDYEIGDFRHALLDGVYGRIRFPTCWCVADIPEKLIDRMEALYRGELINGCPCAADDRHFFGAAVAMTGVWLLRTLIQMLDHSMSGDGRWGISTGRQRVILRLGAFSRFAAAHEELPSLCDFALRLSQKLGLRWGSETMPMPLYDAFSRPYDPGAAAREAFTAAVVADDLDEVRRLIDRDVVLVNSRFTDENSTPALFYAVEKGMRALALLLIERGANLFAAPMSGTSILEAAVITGDLSVIDALLANGADVNYRSLEGSLPIYGAIQSGPPALVQQLLDRGARLDLLAAYRLDRLEIAREILESEPDSMLRRMDRGEVLLHVASAGGPQKLPFVRLLLEHGADPNATDGEGRTPLHASSAAGDEAAAAVLLAHGADPEMTDRSGKKAAELTPLPASRQAPFE